MARNPMFNEKAFQRAKAQHQQGFETTADSQEELYTVRDTSAATAGVMTLQGTINKTFFLLFVCVLGGMFSWTHPQAVAGYFWLLLIGTLGIAFATAFKPAIAPFTAPVYAVVEGLMLGAISAMYNAQWNGIVFNSVAITVFVFLFMLGLYRFQVIRVTTGLIRAVVAATLAVCVLYLGSLVLSLFGVNPTYLTSSSPLSIGISIVVCGIAAFNFLLDFEFINRMTSQYAVPKYMEWYAGFSLLVTLIWLYLEILQLLAKLNRR